MATDNERKTFESKMANKQNGDPSHVTFDLEGSQPPDDFSETLDEVDEFLELSTLSNVPSTSSLDSTANIIANESTVNTKPSLINSMSSENKSGFKRYQR
jgi:hypothetical protein